MSTYDFIQAKKTRIENIDGNMDDGSITIMNDQDKLEFYQFEDGVRINGVMRVTEMAW